MRKDIVKKSLIILIIGIILAVAGISLTADYLKVGTTYISQNGMYTSSEINITGKGLINIEGGNFSFYLIKYSDLGKVDRQNIENFSLTPVNSNSPKSGDEFLVPPGSYVLVSFINPPSGIIYSYASHEGTFTELGVLLLVGIFMVGVSIIVLIIGILKREKFKPPEEEFFKEENKE
ncbi:hypothetical protein ACNF42_02440 [Cuniculiplasma sp. SKW3]|uniref:hypothetical protein n=1 Tax=Cuniculiplasma sp. SKW3 TaxID=3400170 RepID=UPI003FD4A1DF